MDIPYYPNFLSLTYGKKAIIPCGTSNPSYNVTFMCECHKPKPLGPEDGIMFDPRDGFIIAKTEHSMDGLYKCFTTVNNQTFVRIFTFVIEGEYLTE